MSPIKQAAATWVLAATLATNTAAADVAAIVSAKSSVSAATPQQVADIYLGRSSRFPDGTPAVPCDLAEGSPTREEFYTKILGKSSAQMKAHWAKIIFTGRGQPPREAGNSEEAKKLVQSNPQMICYIDSSAVDKSVNVLFVR